MQSLLSRSGAIASLCFLSQLPAQANWVQPTFVTPTPGGRYLFGFAYDSHSNHAVLFGGRMFGGTYTNQTWQYDGSGWLQLTPSSSPPGIATNAMVYDSARRRMVLFSGENSFGFWNETWEFDGNAWLQRFPTTSPPARNGCACVYDPVRRRVVIFGGWDGTRRNDTWEYDGTDWAQIFTANTPVGRSDHLMAYDEGRNCAVLYGGYNDVSQFLGDTWEYDGVDWVQRFPANSAGPLADPAMVYDRGRGRVVLFGGKASWFTPNTNATYEYDGTTWTDLTPTLSAAPSGRWVAQMVYDEARGRTIAFGGIDNFNQFPGDTWELVTPNVALHRTFGHGCPGTAGTPQLLVAANGMPRLGSSWQLELQNLPVTPGTISTFAFGLSNTSTGALALPLPLAAAGMPGCTLFVSPDVVVATFANTGVAAAGLAIPAGTGLIGLHVFVQGGVLDPGANPAGLVLSEAADGRIGI